MSYFMLDAKNSGNCKILTGRIMFYMFYVSDPYNSWTKASATAASKDCEWSIQKIKKEAKRDKVFLQCLVHEEHVMNDRVMKNVNAAECQEQIARKLGNCSMSEFSNQMERKYAVNSIVYVYLLNRSGRSFAMPTIGQSSNAEKVVLFPPYRPSFIHEVMHLYGAADYYYPERLKSVAQRIFPRSVMLTASEYGEIDEMTRYLIGWHLQPTDKARMFMSETNTITRDEVNMCIDHEWKETNQP